MTLQQFLAERAKADDSVKRLLEGMSALQKRISDRLADDIADLDTSNGRLVASEANINRINGIIASMERDFPDPEWQRAVGEYLRTFDVLDKAVIGYVGELGVVDAAVTRALRIQFKQQAADYLLSAQSFQGTLGTRIAQEVGASIASGGGYRDLVKAIDEVVDGMPDKDGALVGYARTSANDLVSIYERSATQIVSDAVGAEFYWYQGRPIDTTRPFCRARANKYFHRREIEAWGDLEPWSGQIPGTNSRTVFTLLGGYNCRHVLVPVARRDVPKEDIERMKSKGLIA